MAAVAAAKIPACNRCRLRKTKCDAQLPACTPCQKAGVECHGEDHAAGRPVSRSYIWALEQRIKELEASATEAPSGSAAATCSTSPAPAPDVSASSASTGTSASARPEYGAASSASMAGAVAIPTTPARGDSNRGARPRAAMSHSEGGAGRSARHSNGSHARKRPRHDDDEGDDDENDDDDDENGNDNEHDVESDGIQSRRRSVVENDFYRPPQHDPLSRLVQAALQDAETDTSRSSPGPNGGESGEDGDGTNHQDHQHRQKQQHDQQQQQDQQRRHATVAQEQPDNGPHPPTRGTAAGPSPSSVQQQQQQQQRQGTSAMPLPNGDTRRSWLDRELAALSALRATVSRQVRRLSVKDRFEPARYERKVVDAIVRRYFTYMNCPLPCLHEQAFAIQVDDYCTNSSLASPMDRYQLLMVFAVALASLGRAQYLTSETSQLARQFYYAAVAHASHTPRSGWRKLQNVLLQVQYHLLVPNSKDLWRLSGEAMRLVTELGLYAEPRVANPLLADMSKRLFWTTYSIERMLACVYGRPLTLAEDWISVGLPAVVEDKCITSQGFQKGPVCHLKLAHHLHIHARRLQAEIHGRLYTPTSAGVGQGGDNNEEEEEEGEQELEAWTWKMQGELQRWHESFTVPSPFVTKNWVDLQYHLLTTTLLRPSPRRPNPSMDCLRRALQSSGEVLKIYRRLQRELAINFVGMAIRNLFLSGLTFLHSLQALSQHGGGDEMPLPLIDVVLQVQDCTVVLESLTAYEEVSTARRLRDAFEKASTSVLRLLSQRAGAPSSSSTMSSFSRPPPYFPSNGRAASESTSPHSTASTATATLRGVLTDREEREHFFAHDIDAAPLPEHPKCPDRRLYAMGNGDTAAASRPTRSASTVAAASASTTSSSSSWRPSQNASTAREQVSPRPWATATTPQHAHERPQAQAYAEEQMLLDLAQSQHPQRLQQQQYSSSSSSSLAAALDMSEYFFQPYFESLGSAPSQLSSSGGGVVSQNSGGSGSSSSAIFSAGGALGGGFDAGSLLMGPPQHPLGNTPDSMSAGRIDFGPGLGSSGGAGPDSGFGLDSLADLFSSPGYA